MSKKSKKTKKTVEEVWPIFEEMADKPFSKDSLDESNKGAAGHKVEKDSGIALSSDLTDLSDGEVKSHQDGQTISISMVRSHIDEMVEQISFRDSWIYEKIQNIIFIPKPMWNATLSKKAKKVKEATHIWYAKPILWNEDLYPDDFKFIEEDWNYIVKETARRFDNNEILSTINGPNEYIQIRTKGSTSPRPILYKGRMIAEKDYNFYFMDKKMGKYFFEQRSVDIDKTISEMGRR